MATVLVGSWTDTVDKDRLSKVLDGEIPFDEQTMVDDDSHDRKPAMSGSETS